MTGIVYSRNGLRYSGPKEIGGPEEGGQLVAGEHVRQATGWP